MDDVLQRQARPRLPLELQNEHWTYYAYKSARHAHFGRGSDGVVLDPAASAGSSWKQAFHGTWFYSLWNILAYDYISASDDIGKGHEFNKLGAKVYMSPAFGTAKGYARSQNVFGDGVYHCAILELRVNETQRHKRKVAGGIQWTYDPEHVYIVGVWFGHNIGNSGGCEHLRFWDCEDEALPRDRVQARVVCFFFCSGD